VGGKRVVLLGKEGAHKADSGMVTKNVALEGKKTARSASKRKKKAA